MGLQVNVTEHYMNFLQKLHVQITLTYTSTNELHSPQSHNIDRCHFEVEHTEMLPNLNKYNHILGPTNRRDSGMSLRQNNIYSRHRG